MRQGRKTTAAASAVLVGRRLLRVVPFVLFLTAAGCVPEPAFENDPLVGGRPLPRNGPTPSAPSSATAAAPLAASGPLQLPPPTGSISPAALSMGSSPAADASGLRIGPPMNQGPPQGALTSAGPDGWHGAPVNAGPQLRGPEPITDGTVKPIAVIAPPTPAGAATTPPVGSVALPALAGPGGGDPYGQLQDMLAQRGVVFQALEGPDEHGAWRFRCGVPSRDKPGATHEIELTAPGERGLAAMRGGIEQIDRYQRGE